ncbi:MAG: 6-phosphogluconolactonase, partial [Candidatus Hydrogenedentes bacterium]|nr:6-phosphogluconolactonase [Candidatus Hydrogenedentota bacterium]
MAVTVRPFPDERSFTEAIIGILVEELTRDCETPHAVMLSGGNTPLAAYNALAGSGVVASATARVLFSDERMVPADSLESNFGNAAPMLSALEIRNERLLCVHTELPLEAAADRYDADVAAFFGRGGRIGLGLLGIGVDGHTASLVTLADVERGADRWAIPV